MLPTRQPTRYSAILIARVRAALLWLRLNHYRKEDRGELYASDIRP
jgi:hypothetical protein